MRRRLWFSLLLLAVALVALQVWPLRLPDGDPRARPALPLRQTGRQVLLLVEPSLFSGVDAPSDLQWRDILRRLFGECDIQPVDRLDADAAHVLEARRLVVVGAGTLAAGSMHLIEKLQPFVQDGLEVMLEAPQGKVAEALGVNATGLETRTRLPWPQLPQNGELGTQFRLMPGPGLDFPYHVVSARPAPIQDVRPRPTLSPAGRPLVWTLPDGDGAWILQMVDLGSMMRSMWDGQTLSRTAPTVDRAAATGLCTTDLAWADAWLHALLDPDSAREPWPQLWPTAADRDGWLVVSQDAPEAQDPAVPTRFARTGSPDGLLGAWPGIDAPDSVLPRAWIGLGPLHVAWRPRGLAWQRKALASGADLHRNLRWQWPAEGDRAWKALVGAGFRADSSFGPGLGEGGFTSGTSLPFSPLASDGRPHAIVEVPVQWRGRASDLDLDRVARWLRDNQVGAHGAVHLAIEGTLPRETWESLRVLADRYGHGIASISDVLDVLARRQRVTWRWDFQERSLHVEVDPAADDGPPLAFAVPRIWSGRRLIAWDATWAGPRARKAVTFGQEVLVIEQPRSGGAVTFTYGG